MIRIFHHYVSRMALMLLVLELCILLAAALASAPLWQTALAFALVMVFSMGTLGMYRHHPPREHIKGVVLRIAPSFVLGFGLMHLVAPGRLAGTVFVLGAGAVLLARLVVFTSARSSMLEQRLLIVGDGAMARECLELAESRPDFHPFRVIGFLPVAGEMRAVPPSLLLPADLPLLTLARRYAADEIVVTVVDRRNGAFPVRQLLECAVGGVPVTDAATFFEREACQIRIDTLQPSYRNSRLTLRISIISSTPRLAAYTAPDHDQARGSPSSPNSATLARSTEPTRSAMSALLGSCGA